MKHRLSLLKTTLLLIGGGLAALTVFASCENFLKGGQVRDEILDAIAYNNAPECTVNFSDEGMGSFLVNKKETFKVGYASQVQFEVKTNDYSFIGLKAVKNSDKTSLKDYVKFELVDDGKVNTANDIYKYNITILKERKDILIIPDFVIIPKVSSVYPPFDPKGYDQDTTIQITFNTQMDEESFQNFSELQIQMADGTDVKSFYETPYFSADKTILNIPTKKNCHILEISKEAEHADITINLPASIKDAAGNAVSNLEPYTYRINNTIDIIKPVITSVKVYSTGDDSDHFYRQLTDKSFEQWEDEDFYCNVVYKPYICIQGYDNLSGIKKVHIKETLERNASNVVQDGLVYEADYGINSFVSVTNQAGEAVYNSDGYPLMQYALEYDFKSGINGLVLLEITVIDNSENESAVSRVEMIINKNSLNGGYVASTITENENGTKKLSFGHYNNLSGSTFVEFPWAFYSLKNAQNQTITYNFANREKIFSIDIYEEGGSHHLIKDKEIFTVLTDAEILGWINEYFDSYVYTGDIPIYFKFNYENETVDKKEFITALPASPNAFLIYDNEKNPVDVKPDTEYQNLNISSNNGGYTHLYYTYQADTDSTESGKTYLSFYDTSLPEFLSGKENGIYRFYYKRIVTTNPHNGGMSSLAGAYGKPAVYYKGIENPCFINNVQFPDFNILEDSIIYERNSGTAKLTVDVTFPQNEYRYFIQARSAKANTTNNYFSSEKAFEIPSGEVYYFSLVAKDSEGNIVANSTEKSVDLNEVDNHPPKFGNPSKIRVVDSNHLVLSYDDLCRKPYDLNENNEEEQSIKAIDVFFVLQGLNSTVHADEVTSSYLQRITVPIDYSSNSFLIPIDGFREGFYQNYYLFIQDDSELNNYTWYCGSMDYKYNIYYTSLKPEVIINSNEITILSKIYKSEYCPTVPESYSSDLRYRYGASYDNPNGLIEDYLDTQKNEWKYFKTKGSNNEDVYTTYMNYDANNSRFNYTRDISSVSNTYYKVTTCFRDYDDQIRVYSRPVYIYPDYWRYKDTGAPNEIFCHEKSWLKVQNGYHVFCDAPCFVHTMYSTAQFTQTNTPDDAAEWEARGLETGIVSSYGYNFTYTDDNLASIPTGYYYTTIVHFVDGTVLMSEVMQK